MDSIYDYLALSDAFRFIIEILAVRRHSQVVCGLFMGRAADLYNRKNIVFYGVVIWNLATVWMGLANTFAQLLMSRIVLGIGESFSMPASYSLIADYFPADSLAQVYMCCLSSAFHLSF